MKALDEYFLMVVFPLLLNRVYVSANIIFNFNRKRFSAKIKYNIGRNMNSVQQQWEHHH